MSFLNFEIHLTPQNLPKWLLLKSLSLLFSFLVRLRLLLYRTGILISYPSQKPVISIGNITVGGTGKTPMIDWFLAYCSEKRINAAVLTRGYGAKRSQQLQILTSDSAKSGNCETFGDEPWLLFRHHPRSSFYISPNRVNAARLAEKENDLLLLDDGMQHMRLNRNLNIVLVDCVSGFGNQQMLPLGPLREPLKNLKRADAVVYSRSNLVSSQALRRQLVGYLPDSTPQFDSKYLPAELVNAQTIETVPATSIAAKRCLLFSGIGNPTAFEKTVESLSGLVVDHLVLNDHQPFDASTRRNLKYFTSKQDYELLICTEKDWVKLEAFAKELPRFWFLTMKVKPEKGFIDFIENFFSK